MPGLPKDTILQALQNEISHANHLMTSGGHFEVKLKQIWNFYEEQLFLQKKADLRQIYFASSYHFQMVTASVPIWARWLVLILLIVVVLAIYIANCITKKISGSSSVGSDFFSKFLIIVLKNAISLQRQKSSVAANRRSSTFRAGFAGGVMMGQSQHKKSVMMFR